MTRCMCGDSTCPRCNPSAAEFERALERFTDPEYDAWERMGSQACKRCGAPLRPCPKGPGADEPGFVGFWPCPNCANSDYSAVHVDVNR